MQNNAFLPAHCYSLLKENSEEQYFVSHDTSHIEHIVDRDFKHKFFSLIDDYQKNLLAVRKNLSLGTIVIETNLNLFG